MELERPAPDRVVVRHGAGTARLVAALVIGMGGYAAVALWRAPGASEPWLRAVVVVFLMFGGWLLWAAQSCAHEFDLRRQEARLHWRRFVGPPRRERVPFTEIVDVVVDHTESYEDGDMWRATLLLRGDRRLPLTPYWVASRAGANASAAQIRELLESARAAAADADTRCAAGPRASSVR